MMHRPSHFDLKTISPTNKRWRQRLNDPLFVVLAVWTLLFLAAAAIYALDLPTFGLP